MDKMTIGNLSFEGLSSGFPITNILWIVLVLAVLVFAAVSAALIYHWRQYGMGGRRFVLVESVYIGAAVIFVLMAIISILFI